MGSKREIRASDQDRECAAEVLRDAFAVGCLDDGELEQRGGAAYRARTLGELWDLTADLPGWLLDRPVALPDEYCYARPRRRMGSAWPWALILGLAVFWLIAIALAWAPLAAIPLVLVWLLVLVREQGLTPRAARRQARSPARGQAVVRAER